MTNNKVPDRTETFVYDPLNRISSAITQATSGADCWGQSFTDDSVANLYVISSIQTGCSVGTLSANVTGTTNQLGFPPPSPTYDNSGNMTSDGTYTYTFDAESRITNAASVNYTYDGDGLRVEKSSGTGTFYWRTVTGDVLAETDASGNTKNEYVYFAGRRIAWWDGAAPQNLYYIYTDALGSTRTIAEANGTTCYDSEFTPYGQELNHTNLCPSTYNYKFTGYERDPETGLDYAFARYYSSRLGRFMSLDSLGGQISDPQSLNRYAYVGNRPTKFTDPLGQMKKPCVSRQIGACLYSWGDLGGGDDDTFGDDFFVPVPDPWSNDGDLGVLDLWYSETADCYEDTYGDGAYCSGSRIASIVDLALHQPKLSQCLNAYFGPGNILSNQNLPKVDTTQSKAQLSAQTGNSEGNTIGATQQPVPSSGPGTVEMASEYFYGSGTTNLQLAGTYLHETANILAYQTFTNTRYVQRPYQGPLGANPKPSQYLNEDPDIGVQFEKCVFGTENPK